MGPWALGVPRGPGSPVAPQKETLDTSPGVVFHAEFECQLKTLRGWKRVDSQRVESMTSAIVDTTAISCAYKDNSHSAIHVILEQTIFHKDL